MKSTDVWVATAESGWVVPTWVVVIAGSFLCVVLAQLNRAFLTGSGRSNWVVSLLFLSAIAGSALAAMTVVQTRTTRRSLVIVVSLCAAFAALYLVSVWIYA